MMNNIMEFSIFADRCAASKEEYYNNNNRETVLWPVLEESEVLLS